MAPLWASLLIALATTAFAALAPPARAQTAAATAVSAARPCPNADEFTRFDRRLARMSIRLAAGLPVKIVAIGSSSTAGAGASGPAATYPARLAAELSRRLHSDRVKVVNLGVNGEEAADMLARFDTGVLAEKPDLVLWQVGTNSLLRDSSMDAAASLIREGIRRLKGDGVDVVLIDPQFAPKVLAKSGYASLVRRLSMIAKEHDVGVFHRFALMQHWKEVGGIPFEAFVSPDGLHMNDWSYACWANAMAAAISEAATRHTETAAAIPHL